MRGKKYYPPKPKPIYLSQEGLDEAQRKVKELAAYREEVLVRLQTAREMGDLSENGAYTAARFELSATDRKLRHYNKLVRYGVVKEKQADGRIDMSSIVTLEKDNQQFVYTLVSGYESDPAKGKLSVYSPIGKAIMGKQAGDEVVVATPNGEVKYKISKVE